jgi:hypothetical protein
LLEFAAHACHAVALHAYCYCSSFAEHDISCCLLLLGGTHLSGWLLVAFVLAWSLATVWTMSAWAALDVVALLLA